MATQTVSALETAASVETVSNAAEFGALESEWNSLLQSSAADCFFLTFEWLATWWKHLGGEHTLAIRTVRVGGLLVAIAPLAMRRARPLEGHLLPALEFLGSGFAGSDYLDLIVREGYEESAIGALARELRASNSVSAFTLRLSNVRQPDSLAARLMALLRTDGWHADEIQINVCPFIELEGHSWDSFLGSLGSETRYNFNRKWKRLNRDFTVEFDEATRETVSESIALLIAQHNQRWRDRGGSDAFHTAALPAFHRDICEIALGRGWLRLYTLKLNGSAAASLYGFLYRGTFNFYQSGFDPAFEKHSVGFLTMGCAIQKALAEGAREYDLLHGNESYKSHWTSQSRPLGRLEIHPPGLAGLASQGLLQMGRTYRNVARRVLRST
ncbi:MAG: GNAT family N-acetyltransferase [Acidobacteriota bacterium]|nr:GNAT family N-acetyltransferase [Acidobacteriota bacterium]